MAAYAALVSVMHIIDNLQHHPRPPISLHKKQLRLLTEKVTFLQEFLEGYNPHLGYNTEADPLESRIADAAYAAEDVIETHFVEQMITSDGEKMSSNGLYEALEKVIEEIAFIEKEAMAIKETTVGVQNQLHRKSTPSDPSSSIAQKKSSMVGADDVLLEMKDKLTSHRRDLQIIPIVGMGGTGKTTLAINIYQDRLIKESFDMCAWATISQEYSIQEILAVVYHQLNENAGQPLILSEDILGELLYKHLYGRKYVIVMDDVWSIDAWDAVERFFPDNKNGSRIVITTRLSNLASKLSDFNSLEMKLLDEDDSWELLSKTVFGEKGCPLELEEIGKKIGNSCKGLPLSIVVVGGLLAKSQKTREIWENIEENLNAIVNLEDDERCLKILHISYKQLPVYLKPCFLYMGVFPEDEVICISKLVKLMVAEGFLKPIMGKSLEEIGKVYLKDLICRNLILIHEQGSTGNVKYCKIHDLLRDLCLREAQKERFYAVLARPSNPRGINCLRRIVISSTILYDDAINTLPLVSQVRSLTGNLEYEELPPLSFSFLRILHSHRFQCTTASAEFLKNMHELVNSRFLAFSPRSSECEFPSSIWLFWNLQTLIVTRSYRVTAPTDIWFMPHIRHVEVQGLHLPDPPNSQLDDIVLGNLQTLGTVVNFKCSEQVVKRMPNIKKLQVSYDEGLDDDGYCLTNLDCLHKLESLRCFILGMNPSGPESLQGLINFPHSLKKLSLHISQSQCWEDILDKIGMLPLLQKLQLDNGSFREGHWETIEGLFRNLKFLSVRYCWGLQLWTTESSHFPCLEYLLLHQVHELNEIPLDFAEILTLRAIDVKFCSTSVVVSAKRVLEEQEELYGEETALQVQVTHWRKDEVLESLASTNFRVTSF